jgi:sialidase-1
MMRTFLLAAMLGIAAGSFGAWPAIAADVKDNAAPAFEEQTLFKSGADGYQFYRIPAMVVTNQGTVLCFAEARKHGLGDYGDIDIALRRSTDGGRTWSKMEIIADDGVRTIGNPCPVVEARSGKIWLPFCRDNQQMLLLCSYDDGKTWQGMPPLDITRQTVSPEYYWVGAGPGHGVQLSSGRLVIPCWASRHTGLYSGCLSYVFYSDEAGLTWQRGGVVDTGKEMGDECEAVELSDGTLYINLRSPTQGKRGYSTSKDGGRTWSPVQYDPQLVAPACQGSIVRFTDRKRHDKDRILLSTPTGTDRANLTVRLSYDECKTWPVAKLVHKGSAAYSDLAVAHDQQILLLYEADDYSKINLARFNLTWLTDGKDHVGKKAQ